MILLEDDVSQLSERMKRELIRGEHARAEFAIHAQRRLKAALDQMPARRTIDGIGQIKTTICKDLAARLRVKYGATCLHDSDFVNALLRDNPFLRVNTVPARLSIRVDGLKRNIQHPTSNIQTGQPERNAGQNERHGAQGDPAPADRTAHETAVSPAGVSLDLP